MSRTKISVSLPTSLVAFIEAYRAAHGHPTTSRVVADALVALRRLELERAYAQAAAEDDPVWAQVLADGLPTEPDEAA